MEDTSKSSTTFRTSLYRRLAIFAAVVVFVPLSLATILWLWLHDARAAGTCFAALFPATWLAATYFIRRRAKFHVDAP